MFVDFFLKFFYKKIKGTIGKAQSYEDFVPTGNASKGKYSNQQTMNFYSNFVFTPKF